MKALRIFVFCFIYKKKDFARIVISFRGPLWHFE